MGVGKDRTVVEYPSVMEHPENRCGTVMRVLVIYKMSICFVISYSHELGYNRDNVK